MDEDELTIYDKATTAWQNYNPKWLEARYDEWQGEDKLKVGWTEARVFTVMELRDAFRLGYIRGVTFKVTGEN